MEISEYFPMWNKLSEKEQKKLTDNAFIKKFSEGTVVHGSNIECTGLLLIRSGQFRAYIMSDEGREVTIYRLFERDICLFAASCIMKSIQFDITISVERDSEVWVIPAEIYKEIMENSAPIANYTREIMETRFTDVMWLIEQIMWKSFDKRLVNFLLEESAIEGSNILQITHEKIAAHLGSAREVVTRMLKYFQNEGMVKLQRGSIEITDFAQLSKIEEK